MSIFGTSGKRDRMAAMANAMQAQQTQNAIDARLNAGQLWGTQTLDAAQPQQIAALDTGRAQQVADLRAGADTQRADYQRAADSYAPYTAQGQEAWSMLGDAAGLHGQEGHDRALGAFQAGPSYDWDVSQSMDQAARGASASGQLLSGNAATAMQDRAHHLADQEYGNWYNRVNGISQTGFDATNKVAAIDTGMGDNAYHLGSDLSGVWGTDAARRAGIYGDTARAKAGIYGNTAIAGANALSRTGDRIIDANNTALKGSNNAEANQSSLIKDLLGGALKIGGSIFGGKA